MQEIVMMFILVWQRLGIILCYGSPSYEVMVWNFMVSAHLCITSFYHV